MHNFVSCTYTGNSQTLLKVVDVKLAYLLILGFTGMFHIVAPKTQSYTIFILF